MPYPTILLGSIIGTHEEVEENNGGDLYNLYDFKPSDKCPPNFPAGNIGIDLQTGEIFSDSGTLPTEFNIGTIFSTFPRATAEDYKAYEAEEQSEDLEEDEEEESSEEHNGEDDDES